MVEKIFFDTIGKYKLIEKKDKVILAVSGGPDSVCMLHLFKKIKDVYKLGLVCAHFNHGLREEADKDEEFVRKICGELKIQFTSSKKDVKKFFRGNSLEQTARFLRFDFFLACARHFKIKKIALAHNKDDVIETVLMRIIRGASLRGLRGILPLSKYKGVVLIRPLIEIRKKEILAWLKLNNLDYRIDKTNFEEKFFRNKIRHKLMPLLEEFNPNVRNAIFNLAKVASFDYDFIYKLSLKEFNILKKAGSGFVKLKLEKLKKLHPAIITSVLGIAIEEIKGNLRRLESRHFSEILELIFDRPQNSIVHLPDLEVKKENDSLIIKSLIL